MPTVRQYLGLFEKAAEGELGADAKTALEQILSNDPETGVPFDQHLNSVARKRRLAELLKKRETTGTATGSASPNPSGGDS